MLTWYNAHVVSISHSLSLSLSLAFTDLTCLPFRVYRLRMGGFYYITTGPLSKYITNTNNNNDNDHVTNTATTPNNPLLVEWVSNKTNSYITSFIQCVTEINTGSCCVRMQLTCHILSICRSLRHWV